MYLAFILAAVLVTPIPHAELTGTASAQATATDENPQKPATAQGQSTEKGSDAQPSQNKAEETPPATKADDATSPKPVSPPSPASPRKRHPRTKKSATQDGEPRKVVIRQGGATEPVAQIVPGISQEEANRQRESAEQLLVASESSINELATRSLNLNQQGMLVQIRQYMDGARSALKENDPQRAHTLALKAYLLSDDLAKHP
jgi:hypothetical protein